MASAAAAKRRYPALAANHRYALTVSNSTGERLRGIEAQRFSLLRNVIQQAFLYDPLVRFIGALNPIRIVNACGRQKLRDPVDALYTAAAEWRGRKAYRLTDFKFVLAHRAVHHAYLASRSTFAEELDFDLRALSKHYCTERGTIHWSLSWFYGAPSLDGPRLARERTRE